MREKDFDQFRYSHSVVVVPVVMILLIWFVYWVELNYGYNFNKYGIHPLKLKGLRGIIFSPFIHSNTSHLFNNSIPLGVLLASLFFFYKKVAVRVLVLGTLITGLLTWVIGRSSYHIGASGVIYLLFSFIFFSGVLRKHYRLVALSLIVVFLYGSMIWYVFPIKEHISWEGHLSGFLTGVFFTFIYKKKGPQKNDFHFEQTEFDSLFDEDGNLITVENELEEK